MRIARIAASAAAMAGVAVGFAVPASADLVDGTYNMIRVDGKPQDDLQLVVKSCGAGCERETLRGNTRDLHLDGNTWRVTYGDGLFDAVDNDSLLFTSGSGEYTFLTRQLVKAD